MSGAPTTAAVVGTGVIGTGWAVQFLSAGLRVVGTDPAPGAEERLRAGVEAAAPVLARAGRDLTGWQERLTFTADALDAVSDADWVQENGPERLDDKVAMLAALDGAAPARAVVASSSSGFGPSALAAGCATPGRVLVGHPFNPVHLVPLVEVVAGDTVDAGATARALAFYARVGKRPVHVRREVPGHLANRLQAALWQEAYSLVQRGVATVEDVDAAVAHGPGLRWALLGPLLTQALAGGPGGMRHVLTHLGPPTQGWMDDLRRVHLDDDLADLLVAGVAEELAGADPTAVARDRDETLVDLLALKRSREDHP